MEGLITGLAHMHAAEHALRYLRGTFDKSLKFSRDTFLLTLFGAGWIRIGLATRILAVHTLRMFLC